MQQILEKEPPDVGPTNFIREALSTDAKILYRRKSNDTVDTADVCLILDKTPFYVESGGQIGDQGRIVGQNLEIQVKAMYQHRDWYIHEGIVIKGSAEKIPTGISVTAEVDAERRWDIMRNHTATHLAHAALRKVLGEHVKQSGSYVGPDRLRFDFSHHQPLTPDEVAEVERLVNEQILKAVDVNTDIMPVAEAKKSGAMALFGEKYGDTVRVVSVPGFSKELCGGTHVTNTGQIGPFFITVETGIASGVRRLEAITGREAQKQMLDRKRLVLSLSGAVNRPESDLLAGVEQLRSDNSALQKEIKKLKTELVFGAGASIGTETKIGALSLWTHDFGETDRETMSAWIDSRKEMNHAVVALGTGITQGKMAVMLAASAAAIDGSKIDAGKLLRDLLAEHGGRGGGKPNFAQGGTPSPVEPQLLITKLMELLKK